MGGLPRFSRRDSLVIAVALCFIATSLAYRFWLERSARRDVNFTSDLAEVRLEIGVEKTNENRVIYATAASGFQTIREAGKLPTSDKGIRLIRSDYGCRDLSSRPIDALGRPTYLVVKRGECSFATKMTHAKKTKYDGVIVLNTIESFFNVTARRNLDPCRLSCIKSTGEEGSRCDEINQLPSPLEPTTTCCTLQSSDLVRMKLEEEDDDDEFVALFVSVLDSSSITHAFEGKSSSVRIKRMSPRKPYLIFNLEYDLPLFFSHLDPSIFGIYLVGVGAFTACCWYAILHERAMELRAALISGSDDDDDEEEGDDEEDTERADEENLDEEERKRRKERRERRRRRREERARREATIKITPRQVGEMLLFATLTLLTIFLVVQFFPTELVLIFQLAFALSSTFILHDLLGIHLLPAALLCGAWFPLRHAPGAFALQDFLCACLCAQFLRTVKLPSFRVGALLLSCFFLYDIFMVFLTPMLFKGRSVMVDVATAGHKVHERRIDDERCDLRGGNEDLPMLFVVPRMEWRGGASLLGLGDVIIPGLLGVLTMGGSKFAVICVSYAIGLGLTFVANYNGFDPFNTGVKGQPALLYLVPSLFIGWKLHEWCGTPATARVRELTASEPTFSRISDEGGEVNGEV